MTLVNTMFQRLGALLGAARGLWPSRLSFAGKDGARDMMRAASAGAILFAFAGAGLGAKGGFAAFRVDTAAAGATVSVGWGYQWFAYALLGAVVGAIVGAAASYGARTWLDARRAGTALLAVGALGGVVAGSIWGEAVARERVVEVRAQTAAARAPEAGTAPRVTVVNGPVRLDGSVEREMNVPLLTFMVLGATVVGAFAARGMAEPLTFFRREEAVDQVAPRSRGTRNA